MRFKRLIVATLVLAFLGPLIFVGAATSSPTPLTAETLQSGNLTPQWATPIGIAITQDGKNAYLSFDTSCLIVKVGLEDLSVKAVTDLADYFPAQCQVIALDATETKLFAYTPTWQKLIVIDTQTMSVIHTIDNINLISLTRSQYGHFIFAMDGGATVNIINTDTYEVTNTTDDEIRFHRIKESTVDPSKWFVASRPNPDTAVAGIYNYQSKNWSFSVSIPMHSPGEAIYDLEVLPSEHKLYVGTFGGWYPEFHSYGWLYAIDLTGVEGLKVIPIDGGAMCLESSADGESLYVGTSWPLPNDKNLMVVDTQTDNVVGQINLGRNKFGGPYTQMNDLQLDPSNPHVLYAANTDANSFIKINLDNLTVIDSILFNDESFSPNFFVKQPTQDNGYVLIRKSARAFMLDLDNATVKSMIEFPVVRTDVGGYDIAIDDTGRMFIAQGEAILEANAQDLRLLGSHPLPPDISGVWSFILSNDQAYLYSIWQDPVQGNGYADTFLAINTTSFQVEARVKFDGGGFNFRPFELPDGSKVYALGGLDNGPVVIKVVETKNFTVQKTITFNETGLLGISAGPYYPFCYDSTSHTLFVGTSHVVLAIDTVTDTVKQIIYLKDSARDTGLDPSYVCYINAVGMIFNPRENCIYIDNFDGCYMSIYNLTSNQFLPHIPLQGLSPVFIFANPDFSKIYCLMGMSDSISVVDVKSKTVEKVINLHSSLAPTTTTLRVNEFTKTYDVCVSSNSSVSNVNFDLASKQISFRAMGSSFAYPFSLSFNVSFPNELLWGNLTVQVDGTPVTEFIRKDNGTHTSLSLIYDLQGAKNFHVTGTETVEPTPTPTPSPTSTPIPTPVPTATPTPSPSPSTNPTPDSTPIIPEHSATILFVVLIIVIIPVVVFKRTKNKL